MASRRSPPPRTFDLSATREQSSMKWRISTFSPPAAPVGHVGLPALVGQGRLEADPARAGSLLGLVVDKAPPAEHPVDGRKRRHRRAGLSEVVVDRPGPGVEAGLS